MDNLLCHLLISQVSQFEDNTVRIFDLIGMIYQRILKLLPPGYGRYIFTDSRVMAWRMGVASGRSHAYRKGTSRTRADASWSRSKVQRHVIARGVFESVADLRRKLMRYIKAYNKTATPLQWTYSNPTNRIAE